MSEVVIVKRKNTLKHHRHACTQTQKTTSIENGFLYSESVANWTSSLVLNSESVWQSVTTAAIIWIIKSKNKFFWKTKTISLPHKHSVWHHTKLTGTQHVDTSPPVVGSHIESWKTNLYISIQCRGGTEICKVTQLADFFWMCRKNTKCTEYLMFHYQYRKRRWTQM